MHKWKFLTAIAFGACLGTWVTMWMEHKPAVASAKGRRSPRSTTRRSFS